MAAPTLAQIREGLNTRLATIGDVQTSAYRLSNPTLPSLQVAWPDEVQYHESMRNGTDGWVLIVMAFAGLMSEKGSQILLDQFIAATGAKSVKAAIEGDTTLGGIVDDTTVVSCTGYREYTIGTKAALGCEWRVEVIAPGS